MCGICGVVNSDPSRPVSAELLEAMTDKISHRGPDSFGFFRDRHVGLGHRRLSIIDLAGGRQPIFNEDESVVVVFNGEIYNYQEITRDLEACGHVFKTRSDTETIVHAYEQYGDECVRRFRGMFAFAIFDRLRQRVLVVRDRLGIKPVYYYHGQKSVLFGSEIKSLLESPEVPREIDQDALDLYLSLRYVPGPRTMFRNIFKLQPGHLMVIEDGDVKIRKYWDVPYGQPTAHTADPEEFTHLLEESVRLRLMTEVPLGVFLSGGIDSSAILAVMSKLNQGERIKTFSVGYQGNNPNNEFVYARQAAEAFGAEHHEFRLSALDFRDFIPQLVWHLDEPLADPSCIPLYFISRDARQYITVVLSGEGADEILAGYGIYPKMLAMENVRKVPGAGMVAGYLGELCSDGRSQEILRMLGLPLDRRYHGVSRGFRPSLQSRLTRRGGCIGLLDPIYRPLFEQVSNASVLDQILYADTKVWLPDDLLLKADKMTMANALELRVPFLDHKLVEYAAQLPQSAKLQGNTGKVLLRQTMKGILPDSILNRPKQGFPVPTMDWLRGPLKDFTRDTLLASDSPCARYFDSHVLHEIVDRHELGGELSQEVWTLLVFEHWHRAFVTATARDESVCTFDQAVERL